MSNIVIANSVGIDSNGLAIIHSPSRWTSSSKEKNVFTYYPWELAYTSSLVKRETDHCVTLVDGCLEKLNKDEYAERIKILEPDFLLMEPSTRTWHDDKYVLVRIKKECGAKIIVAGQHATAFPKNVADIADYVLIGEYEYTVLDILQGKSREDILGLYPNNRRPLLDVTTLPWPEDTDMRRIQYGVPGEPSSEYLEIQAYASRGCPFGCNFCVCRHLYYARPNWRPRQPQDIVAELTYLSSKYPQMEGIFFDEECHNVQKKFILDLSREIITHRLNELRIDAMCVYYTLDAEMMDAMKAAGYYLLRVGIETAGQHAAKGINLGAKYDLAKLRYVLGYAKKIGLKMYGTFTFGAPGSTKEDDRATLALMDEVISEGLLWRFQTSICTPQPGTPFYQWAKENKFLKTVQSEKYDGGNHVIVEYPDYSQREILDSYMASQKYFDIALKNRFCSTISSCTDGIKELNPKTLLVLRTSRMPQIIKGIDLLRSCLPAARIDIVGQPSVADELDTVKEKNSIAEIYYYENGFFDSNNIDDALLNALQRMNYDAVVLFYNNTKGRGYENAEKFAYAIQPKTVIAFNSDGNLLFREEIERLRNEERELCCRDGQ